MSSPLDSLIAANKLADPNHLEVGQVISIPAPQPLPPGPGFKVIPDSELVRGPSSANFDLAGFIKKQKSRRLIEQLVDTDFIPTGRLAQLVRVPQLRD